MKVVTFNITVDASGDYNSSTAGGVTGATRADGPWLLYAVEWVDTNFDVGVDAVLSDSSTPSGADTTLLTLTNADAEARYYPQVFVCDNTGTNTNFYAPQIVTGTLKLVVSNGGNAKTGKLIAYLVEM